MRIRSLCITAVLVVAAALGLTACGGDGSDSKPTVTPTNPIPPNAATLVLQFGKDGKLLSNPNIALPASNEVWIGALSQHLPPASINSCGYEHVTLSPQHVAGIPHLSSLLLTDPNADCKQFGSNAANRFVLPAGTYEVVIGDINAGTITVTHAPATTPTRPAATSGHQPAPTATSSGH
jgi:hypothetical protein